MRKQEKNQGNKKITKPIVVLYHADCPDGFGAAWAAWRKFGRRATYIAVHHQTSLPKKLEGKEIYTIDFTYPEPEIRALMRNNKRVTAIDHHISAKEVTLMTREPMFALNHSGAVLAWKYFHPKKDVPTLLRYIEDRDIWKWRLPNARQVLLYIDVFPFEFGVWSILAKSLEMASGMKKAREAGMWIHKFESAMSGKIAKRKEAVRFEGHRVYAVNAAYLFADNVGALLYKEVPFAILWNVREGRVQVSLRSAGKVDVSKIAQKYGGGGHRASAGFVLPYGEKLPWKRIATLRGKSSSG